ncbi:transmembrane protein C16orf54 homolog [Pseudonaja textilis]|uniref:transmembrane protein C16orf54 homolog n=1 Tax=Pseudonaja textilis TaxID=8673 RepID=UPI000EA978CD|nr:transmembrane protein C16orf54 homolog [Pseudonaja textilis]
MLGPPTNVEMLPPSTASPLSDCGNCLLIMVSLATVAAVFIVVSAVLCERVFRGSLPQETGAVPTVWRQGGTLWIEPHHNNRQPDVLSRPSATVPLWIQRSNDWFLDVSPAGPDSYSSTEDLQRETASPSSTSPLWSHSEQSWAIQPHVTLPDINNFFRKNSHVTCSSQHLV